MMLSSLKKFFYLDVSPLIALSKKKVLGPEDMLSLPIELSPKNKTLKREWLNFSSPMSFLISTLKMTRKQLIPAYIWYLASTICSLLSPYFINRFIKILDSGVNESNYQWLLINGILLAISGLCSGLFVQQFFVRALHAYQIITNVSNELIFKHSLNLSPKARAKNLVGDIVNFMGTDSESVADFSFVIADLFMNLLLAITAMSMLFYYIGYSALTALIIMLLMIPLTKKIAKKFIYLEDELMALRDKRVTMMGQVLNSIRVVKYFAFETSVEKEILDIREEEIVARKKLAKSQVVSGLSYTATSTFVLFVALYTHAYLGHKLDAALIFTCVSLFGILEGPIGELSHHLSRVTNAFVGAKRILKYLSEEEVMKSTFEISDLSMAFKFEHFNFAYEQENVLHDLTFELKKGESLAIIGEVGAGKSTLLSALLGELSANSGRLLINSNLKLAYLPQEAYIINESLKENILFGNHHSAYDRLNDSLIFSALNFDISKLPAGLNTEIGEKGVNLSGGQKQRVGLARAYVQNPDLILLDDPLSAVDHKTENYLVENLFFQAFKDKTLVVATHRLNHLKRFDKILFLSKGKMAAFGNYLDVLKNHEFQAFYRNHEHELEQTEDDKIQQVSSLPEETNDRRITEDEDREVGAVKKDVYLEYIKSLGGDTPKLKYGIIFLLFLGAILIAVAPLGQKSWLSYYSNHTDILDGTKAILIYGLLGIGVLVINALNSIFWLERGIVASRLLHDQMLRSVLNTTIRFFDSTPVGRILQRFSRDVESVDVFLQWSFISVINCILQVLVSLFLIVSVMPLLILFIIPSLLVYYLFQRDYRGAAREAKRFDSIARSPRYAHFKESLMGLSVIRAFGQQDYFLEEFYVRLAESQRMFYSHYMLNRWFSSRIPIIGGLISLVCVLGLSYYGLHQNISSGVAGLVTIYSLSFWSYLNWGVRVFADIESRMTSVERLKYFANLPPEENGTLQNHQLELENWPTKGLVEAIDVKVKYAPHLPLVLKGINFKIKGGSKVGIIGRTGSGKSTIFQALFRFVDIESGYILIDGINIKEIPLKKLRKNLAIIPQDPTLFMGSLRSNLDRYQEYSDHDIFEALKLTGLYEFINSLPEKLNTFVNESGSNLSQGQRQLICLARAILIKSKIVVMDEATASVDVKTDALIQDVIRNNLKDVTLIIIAHRLGTIKDCDQIIEISEGRILSNKLNS